MPIEGMGEAEAYELINRHARRLGAEELIGREFREALYRESEGHPYVIKVLIGETVKAGRVAKIERIVASREDILSALFLSEHSMR